MSETSIPLEYPDYRKLSRSGEGGRLFETRIRDAPRIFCPYIVKIGVTLGKSRNGVGLSSADMMDAAETCLGLDSETIIDVYGDDRDCFLVSLRESPPSTTCVVGQSIAVSRHDVSLKIEAIEDTCDDNSVSRRSAIESLVNADTLADSVYVTVPQSWVIPDPEFRPRTSTLPLYPGSFWLTFFKSVWGVVSGASIVFGSEPNPSNVGLVVRFKEVKAVRQCVLSLHDRYLVHPKEGYGMKMPRAKVVRYSVLTKKTSITPSASYGVQRPPQPRSMIDTLQVSAAGFAAGGPEVPLTVSEAFQKMLEKVERLDRENQRLLALLMDESAERVEENEGRERSPRHGVIPSTGLPPWRA